MKIGKYLVKHLINPWNWFKAFSWTFGGDYVKIRKDEVQDIAELIVYRSIQCERGCSSSSQLSCCGCPWGSVHDPNKKCDDGYFDSTTVENWRKTKEGLQLEFRIGRKGQ